MSMATAVALASQIDWLMNFGLKPIEKLSVRFSATAMLAANFRDDAK
jgi:hypothetical protein